MAGVEGFSSCSVGIMSVQSGTSSSGSAGSMASNDISLSMSFESVVAGRGRRVCSRVVVAAKLGSLHGHTLYNEYRLSGTMSASLCLLLEGPGISKQGSGILS